MRKSTEPITNDVSKRPQHFHDKDIGIGSPQWHTHSSSRTSTLFLWNQRHIFWQLHYPAWVLDFRELHRIPRSPKVVCTWNQKVPKRTPQRWVLMKKRVLTACSCSPCYLRLASILSEKMMSQNTNSYPRNVYLKFLLSIGEDCSNIQMQYSLILWIKTASKTGRQSQREGGA